MAKVKYKQQKYLFLCHAGEKRSPTAARVTRDIADEKELNLDINYAAFVSVEQLGERGIRQVNSYDRVFVMERNMREYLHRRGINGKKIYCLNIKDIYEREDPVLVGILERKLKRLIR